VDQKAAQVWPCTSEEELESLEASDVELAEDDVTACEEVADSDEWLVDPSQVDDDDGTVELEELRDESSNEDDKPESDDNDEESLEEWVVEARDDPDERALDDELLSTGSNDEESDDEPMDCELEVPVDDAVDLSLEDVGVCEMVDDLEELGSREDEVLLLVLEIGGRGL